MTDTASMLRDHERLFHDLGRDLALEGLDFSSEGICVLSFDEIELRFEYQEPRNELLVTSPIGSIPADHSGQGVRILLELSTLSMASGGGTIGLQPGENSLIWIDRLMVTGLSYPALRSWLETTLIKIQSWLPALERVQQLAASSAGANPQDGHDFVLTRI